MALCLIHTGGTIGMGRTEAGFAPVPGLIEGALDTLRARGDLRAAVDLTPLDPPIDSAQATPDDWSRISHAIANRHDAYDGFVVTHGTDTLAYTAAALCFALQGLGRPVILTGSMIPLGEPGSDGLRNLSDALDAAELAPAGVWVQFAGRRLHGGRVRKTHSSDPDAFDAVEDKMPPRVPGDRIAVQPFSAAQVAVLSMAPGVSPLVVAHALAVCDGIVLRCYGSGTVPDLPALADGLQAARDRGALVIAVSQCAEGTIAFGTYAAGDVLRRTAVVDGRDMTVEAAYAKLRHVLALPGTPAQRRARLAQVICGEATVPG